MENVPVEYPAQRSRRAIVQAEFEREEFLRLADYIERNNLKLSQCIRTLVMQGIADDATDHPLQPEDPEHLTQ